LKHLELHGFKTFADHTELTFTPGITAIVGPNGSGKSNIFDGIRWTLGEMSVRSLRSGRMEDVIFAGSTAKRAVGMAEVSLTINNDSGALPVEFAEVTVTRRAVRGGDGEYYLNGTACRLRDIQMLFLGTGLGGRSYSLIGQGQIDSILTADPQARRVLFEEAAGLARYKRRRREAERRLGHAAANLLRVEDVLAELEAQLAVLREQAEAAEQYNAYTRELHNLELALQVDEARRVLGQLKRIYSQVESAQERVKTLAASAAEVGSRIDQSRTRAGEVALIWEDGQRTLLQLVEELGSRESTIQLLQERIRATAVQRDRLLAESQRLEEQRHRFNDDRDTLRRDADALGSRHAALFEGLAQAEATANRARETERLAQERLAAARAETADLLAGRTRSLHDLARTEARLSALNEQIGALAGRRIALDTDGEQQTTKRLETEQTLAHLLGQQLEGESRLGATREQRQQLEAILAAVEEDGRRVSGERQLAASKLAALEELHQQLLGYEEGARSILQAKRDYPERFPGIRYPVLELLKVAPAHRLAIEAALGRRLFSLVSATVEDVKGGMAYLRSNGRGNVTFLPVELLSPPASPSAIPTGSEVVGRATALVEPTNGSSDVVEALLGDVVVVTTLDAAVAVRRQGYVGRIVTLDGEVLAPDGVISVRGQTDDAAVLGRREQIESLRNRLAELDREFAEREDQRRARAETFNGLTTVLADVEAEGLRVGAAIAEQRATLSFLQAEGSRLRTECLYIDEELAYAEEERRALEAETARAQEDADVIAGARSAQEQEIVTLEVEVRSMAEAEAEASSRVADLRVQLAELGAVLDAMRTRMEERSSADAELEARWNHVHGEMAVLDGESHLLEHSLETARDEHRTLAEQQAALRNNVTLAETERATLQQTMLELEGQWRQTQDDLRDLEEQVHRLEVRQAQVDTELVTAQRRITEEFGLTWEAVSDLRLPGSRDEALGRVEALRGLIAALGAVNLRAVDEHRAVADRVASMRAQADDLRRAREALQSVIAYLDTILQTRFNETFAAVNEEFNRLFVRLFEGGRARLELIEGEPGTEPGVEIEAQLPGKKMRSLSAFSGGERVLVAMALIFAMLRVHPSPFCIFDEVEAALDDANTTRFTILLKELAERTQVLIVTHNKGTMEAADVLYGVTMEQPGASKIISMRLARKEVPASVGVA